MDGYRNHAEEIAAARAQMLTDITTVTAFDRAIKSAPIRPDEREGGSIAWIVAAVMLVLLMIGIGVAPALTAEILGVMP